jgi:hypothetical protein
MVQGGRRAKLQMGAPNLGLYNLTAALMYWWVLSTNICVPSVLRHNLWWRMIRARTTEMHDIGRMHALPGFNPSNINHELCHFTGDVTRISRLQP